jgi:hypothetical protein
MTINIRSMILLRLPPESVKQKPSLQLGALSLTDGDTTDVTVRLSLSSGRTETTSTVADYTTLDRVI